jgi:hypothetical protein
MACENKVRVIVTPALPGAPGAAGRETEFRTTATHIQWRYVGSLTWTDLILLTELQGPQGEPGPPGGAVVTYTAGENLSAGRLVILNSGTVRYFQPANSAHAGRAFGVTKTSATNGQTVQVQVAGVLSDAAFSFTPDAPVYARADGELFATPSGTGIVQFVGTALSANSVNINIDSSLIRI